MVAWENVVDTCRRVFRGSPRGSGSRAMPDLVGEGARKTVQCQEDWRGRPRREDSRKKAWWEDEREMSL